MSIYVISHMCQSLWVLRFFGENKLWYLKAKRKTNINFVPLIFKHIETKSHKPLCILYSVDNFTKKALQCTPNGQTGLSGWLIKFLHDWTVEKFQVKIIIKCVLNNKRTVLDWFVIKLNWSERKTAVSLRQRNTRKSLAAVGQDTHRYVIRRN